jgi:colanic acid biosynthesis glycosyl transferase WcaI
VRILIVSQYFWPENFRINDLTEALVERGHSVTVLTGLPNYPSGKLFPGYKLFKWPRETYKGATVIRSPLIPRGNSRGLRLAINYLSFALFASIAGPLWCRGQFDSIFVFGVSPVTVGLPAIVMKFFKQAPIYFWVLDLWPESLSATGAVRSKTILGLVGKMTANIYAQCQRILVQSNGFFPFIERLKVPHKKIVYFPSWAEAIFVPTPKKPVDEFKNLPQGFRILFAGNIGEAQDFPTILSAAEIVKKENPAVQWVVAGDGRKMSWLKAEVDRRKLNENFHFVGTHPLEKMPSLFADADALIVSLKDDPILNVTIPGKIQSYMACGRPIIASLNGTGASVIREANAGFVSKAESPSDLANSVVEMSQMSQSGLESMGQAGRQYYLSNFERSHIVTKLERILGEEE